MKERRKAGPGRTEAGHGGLRMELISWLMIIVVGILSVFIIMASYSINTVYDELKSANNQYIDCQNDANTLQSASDYLTEQVRAFAATGDKVHVDNYYREINETQRRDKAIKNLQEYLPDSETLDYLKRAMDESDILVETETESMRLVVEAYGYDLKDYPQEIQDFKLSEKEEAMPSEEKLALARDILYDDEYQGRKDNIYGNVSNTISALLSKIRKEQENSSVKLEVLFRQQIFLICALLLVVVFTVAVLMLLVMRPLEKNVRYINEKKNLPLKGAFELQYMATVYNRVLDENRQHEDRLQYEAVHDALTGLYNRAGFEDRFAAVDHDTIALILVDVDKFKGINDTYGHAVGDQILIKTAETLRDHFRAEDYVCRIGGDEFVIIMLLADSSLTDLVKGKIDSVNRILSNPDDGLPPVSLSVGVAFGDRKDGTKDMFKDADKALYQVKESGRHGIAFY